MNLARAAIVALVWSASSDAVSGQASPSADPVRLGATLPAEVLNELPTGANVFALLESTRAEVVTDRFNSGGLNAADGSRVAALLGSWSQTRYRIGDVDISSPIDGTPLLFPETGLWQAIDVATAMIAPDRSAPGLAVTLWPLKASPRWSGAVDLASAFGKSPSTRDGSLPPAIARLADWTHARGYVSGPIGSSAGIAFGGGRTGNRIIERGEGEPLRDELHSGFASLSAMPASGHRVLATGWFQAIDAGSLDANRDRRALNDRAIHAQGTFERLASLGAPWRVVAGYTERQRREEPFTRSTRSVDRLLSGPIPDLVTSARVRERRWSIGVKSSPWTSSRVHAAEIGGDYMGMGMDASPPPSGVIGERLGGQPARVWEFSASDRESRRSATSVSAYASDRIALSPTVALDAALRFEVVRGTAMGAASGISWRTLLPAVGIRWQLGTPHSLTFFTAYGRSANELKLPLLAYGDPAAPVARVFRWDDRLAPAGPLVALVGPGTAGDASFSTIAGGLGRPHTDELVIGLESRRSKSSRLQLVGIARRQASLIAVMNPGAPQESYRVFTIPDANADLVGPSDDQDLAVFERLTESFGRDRFVLANSGETATMGAVVITAEVTGPRLYLSLGATAAAAVGPGANRGFRATENDQDMPGESFANPNASTYARGRLFVDRAYTFKWTTVYRFPRGIRLGAIARYQDGQPFSRIVIVDGLAQGAEAIQAFDRGRSRFAFTGTLDVRLQKRFDLRHLTIDAMLDVYNLPNMRKEVEEHVVTGSRYRATTAVQPPRAMHAGLRIGF